MAESFLREKLRHTHRRRKVDEDSCVTFLLCDPGWLRLTNLMSRMNGKKTQKHTLLVTKDPPCDISEEQKFGNSQIFKYFFPGSSVKKVPMKTKMASRSTRERNG